MIPFHELSGRAQNLARAPIERGFTVLARPHGRGHQLKLVVSDEERDWMERRGWEAVEAPPVAKGVGIPVTVEQTDPTPGYLCAAEGQQMSDHFYALRDAVQNLTADEALAWYEALSPGDREIAAAVAREHRRDPRSRYTPYPPAGIDVLGAYLEFKAARAESPTPTVAAGRDPIPAPERKTPT